MGLTWSTPSPGYSQRTSDKNSGSQPPVLKWKDSRQCRFQVGISKDAGTVIELGNEEMRT